MKRALWLSLFAFVVIGCNSGDTAKAPEGGGAAPAKPEAGKKLVVGFSQIGAESDWRTANTEGIRHRQYRKHPQRSRKAWRGPEVRRCPAEGREPD